MKKSKTTKRQPNYRLAHPLTPKPKAKRPYSPKRFHKKAVVVLKDGVEIERYDSLQTFHEALCECALATAAKRLLNHIDGWLDDGMIARYEGEEHEEGRMLMKSRSRSQESGGGIKQQWRKELEETERKIDQLNEDWRAGLITTQERHEQICWLQNHRLVLQRRIKNPITND